VLLLLRLLGPLQLHPPFFCSFSGSGGGVVCGGDRIIVYELHEGGSERGIDPELDCFGSDFVFELKQSFFHLTTFCRRIFYAGFQFFRTEGF